jgi:Tfp pilus assembly protein PilE
MATRSLSRLPTPFSLFEVVLVTAVLGVAVSVAVPEYLDLRSDASDDSAKTRLVQASRTLDQHRATTGTYVGAALPGNVRLRTHSRGSYCVETSASSGTWHEARGAKPASGACPR